MTPPSRPLDPSRRPWLPALVIVLLALAASISGIANQYAQDDVAIVFNNPAVHDLVHAFRFFAEPYWPKPFLPELYRPLALLTFAVQWAVGGGSPLVFRIVSYLLYAAVSVMAFRVARLALPFAAAFAAAAFFAVHPAHVEAVAMAVNQEELWVALLSCLAVSRYVQIRRCGKALGARNALEIGILYLIACFFKETGVVLPGLLAAAELFLVPEGEPLGSRLRKVRPLYLFLLFLAVGFIALRSAVLGGQVRGTVIADTFIGQGVGGRLLTMLTVVPHWVRLLLWPAHLQGDYGPAEIVAQNQWVTADTLGLLIVLGFAMAFLAARRRAPAIAFGLMWFAVAIFPVHNVLVPTGAVLAERTLLLPSVGAMIALGGLAALVLARKRPKDQVALAAVAGMLVILGVYRSSARHQVWSNQFYYWYRTARFDAPESYRAHHALAQLLARATLDENAEMEFRRSIELAPPAVTKVRLDYANRLRLRGSCPQAVPLYRSALATDPTNSAGRASLIACLLDLGQYQEAIRQARIGRAGEPQVRVWRWLEATADSALKVGAPPGTVHLRPLSDTEAERLNLDPTS